MTMNTEFITNAIEEYKEMLKASIDKMKAEAKELQQQADDLTELAADKEKELAVHLGFIEQVAGFAEYTGKLEATLDANKKSIEEKVEEAISLTPESGGSIKLEDLRQSLQGVGLSTSA